MRLLGRFPSGIKRHPSAEHDAFHDAVRRQDHLAIGRNDEGRGSESCGRYRDENKEGQLSASYHDSEKCNGGAEACGRRDRTRSACILVLPGPARPKARRRRALLVREIAAICQPLALTEFVLVPKLSLTPKGVAPGCGSGAHKKSPAEAGLEIDEFVFTPCGS